MDYSDRNRNRDRDRSGRRGGGRGSGGGGRDRAYDRDDRDNRNDRNERGSGTTSHESKRCAFDASPWLLAKRANEQNPTTNPGYTWTSPPPTFSKWDELDIPENLLRGIFAIGFDEPSEVQQQSILAVQAGRDVLVQAQSGTGKTGAFSIGMLSRVDTTYPKTQAIVLSPTHELATQTANVITTLASQMPEMMIQVVKGGRSIEVDARTMRECVPHVVVGCPGRINDLIRNRFLKVEDLVIVVLDEADKLLSKEFDSQLFDFFQTIPSITQRALFSATFSAFTHQITDSLLTDPLSITMKTEDLTLCGIDQTFIRVSNDRDKYDVLKDLYEYISASQCIIYCNSVELVNDLSQSLKGENYPVCAIHSEMHKVDREEAMEAFKSGKTRIMISSNVTARGIDVQQVSVVINFDLPRDVHTYLHRIGRSGRWGRKGKAINFVTVRDVNCLRNIEQYYGIKIKEFAMPTSTSTSTSTST